MGFLARRSSTCVTPDTVTPSPIHRYKTSAMNRGPATARVAIMVRITPTDRGTYCNPGASRPQRLCHLCAVRTPRALKSTRTSLRVHTHACLAISRNPPSCHSPQLFIYLHLFVFVSLRFNSAENISNLVRRRCILTMSDSRPSNELLCTPKEGTSYLARDVSVYQSSSLGGHLLVFSSSSGSRTNCSYR